MCTRPKARQLHHSRAKLHNWISAGQGSTTGCQQSKALQLDLSRAKFHNCISAGQSSTSGSQQGKAPHLDLSRAKLHNWITAGQSSTTGSQLGKAPQLDLSSVMEIFADNFFCAEKFSKYIFQDSTRLYQTLPFRTTVALNQDNTLRKKFEMKFYLSLKIGAG